TLFLDEIGEMALPMQAKLLRILDEQQIRPVGSERETPVNVRVIAATNRRLVDSVQSGEFRQDLYYRLEVVTITVPPLRDRLEDITVLAEHFVDTLSAELGVPPLSFAHDNISNLQKYWWPGNVRELKNVIERFLLLGKLPEDFLQGRESADQNRAGGFPSGWSLAEVEKQHILSVVGSVRGNKSEAARRLGISRKTLERKIRDWESGE
ncbi:MAG: sigma 54-interacting transcriptional regulator, partial [Gammaproteobacteria bacterium]|nr:sigma 54-interacting transcriptional regulator [Gammaproteobacteria bacterium]